MFPQKELIILIKIMIAGPRDFTDKISASQASNYPGIRIVGVATEPSTTVEALESRVSDAQAVLLGFLDQDIEIMADIFIRKKDEVIFFISTDSPALTRKKWAKFKAKVAVAGRELQAIETYFSDKQLIDQVASKRDSRELLSQERKIADRKKRLDVIKEREDKQHVEVVDKKSIVIFGQKGGIGKTVSVVSLASSIAALTNMRAAIMDLDCNRDYSDVLRYFSVLGDEKPEAIKMDDTGDYPVIAEKTLAAWSHIPWGDRSDRIVLKMKQDTRLVESCLVKIRNNLYVLPAIRTLQDEKDITVESVQYVMNILRRHFSVVLVDGGNTLSAPVLAAMEEADEIILLTEDGIADLDSFRDFVSSTMNAVRDNFSFTIAVNKVLSDCDFELESDIPRIARGLPLVARFPFDEALLKMVKKEARVPYLGSNDIPYTREMEKLLFHLFQREIFKPKNHSSGGVFGGLFKKLFKGA